MQTFGSQVFGPWYDVIGWFMISALFFYFAFGAERLPLHQKERLPSFLKNRKVCIIIGLLMALMGVGKALKWL